MNKIVDFIQRRFSKDTHFMDQNCYYFALILHDRFPYGKIYYDVVEGHFIYKYRGNYYDWTGQIPYVNEEDIVEWNKFNLYDERQYERIIEDCLM